MRRAIWTLAVLLSHWRRHRLQLATLLIGLISATALWSGVQALNQQARESYDRAAAIFGGTRTAMLVGKSATFSQELFAKLRRAGWPVSPVLEGRVQIAGHAYRLLGIEPVTLPAEVGNAPALGRDGLRSFITPPGQTLVAPETLADLHLTEGARPEASGGALLPPLLAQAQLVPDVLVVDIGIAQKLLGKPDQISRLLIGKARGRIEPLESIAGSELHSVAPDAESDIERLTDSFHLNLTAFGLLSFMVGLFIVNSAIGLAFEQRLPMLRTIRACGISAKLLNTMLMFELVSLAVVGGLVGMVCGYLIAAALLPDVAASLRGLYGAPIPGELSLRSEWWIPGLAVSIAGALAAATTSLLKAIRLPVLAVAQPQAWREAQRRWLMLQSALALIAFAIAGWLLVAGNSLVAGFALLAALLIGAALILPAILEIVLHGGEQAARSAIAAWFWADSRQQLSGLSLALMALLLALSVNVGVATMVETFSKTFLSWLDGRLAADVYVSAKDDAQANEIKAWLRGRSEVQAILSGGRAEAQIAGASVEVLGLPDHATYREHWPLLQMTPDGWSKLPEGRTCFVSEQLSRRMNLSPGDRIEVPTARGNWPLTIAGIYADYGNPKGQVAVDASALFAHFPEVPRTRMALRVAPGKIASLVTDMSARFRPRWPQPAGPGRAEGGVDADLQPHVCGDDGAERLHARRRGRSSADEPADAGQFAAAAARAAVGPRRDAPPPRDDRTDQDDVGRADHGAARVAARPRGGVVPDCHRQCEGVRLALAVRRLPAATAEAAGGRAGRIAAGIAHSRGATGADAAGRSRQGVFQ